MGGEKKKPLKRNKNTKHVQPRNSESRKRSEGIHEKQDIIDFFEGDLPDENERSKFTSMSKERNAERIRDLPFYELYDDYEEKPKRGVPFK